MPSNLYMQAEITSYDDAVRFLAGPSPLLRADRSSHGDVCSRRATTLLSRFSRSLS